MDRDEILERINNIGTCEDEAQRRTLLDSLRDDINTVFDENQNLTEERDNLTNANESLRACNTDLFLQLGDKKKSDKVDDTGLEKEDPVEPKKFEDLFDEKGEFK